MKVMWEAQKFTLGFFLLVMIANHACSSERTMTRVAFFPISAETLIPITTETIWQSSCKKTLSEEQATKLRKVLLKYQATPDAVIDSSKVRIGIELDGRTYYGDRDLVVHSVETNSAKLGDVELKTALRKFLENDIFSDCSCRPHAVTQIAGTDQRLWRTWVIRSYERRTRGTAFLARSNFLNLLQRSMILEIALITRAVSMFLRRVIGMAASQMTRLTFIAC